MGNKERYTGGVERQGRADSGRVGEAAKEVILGDKRVRVDFQRVEEKEDDGKALIKIVVGVI